MDEEALRAMMPMSFGKASTRGPGSRAAHPSSSSNASTSYTSSIPSLGNVGVPSASELKKVVGPARPTIGSDDDDDDDDGLDEDGLTAEERAANAEADRKEAEQARRGRQDQDDDQDDESSSDEDVDLGPEPETLGGSDELPVAEHVFLKDHSKVVSALSVDASGTRVATGSYDYDVKLWDFGGMTSSFRPFKTFEPSTSHFVHDVAWSPSGQTLLVANGDSQPRLYSRDGDLLATYRKGDPYIRDMKNTNGHVAEVAACLWHPHTNGVFATASADSTVRLWDGEDIMKQKTVIVIKSKERGARTKVTSMAYSSDGKMLSIASLDGTIHVYSTTGSYARPNSSAETAHERGSEISSIAWSPDGRTMASRGCDDSVKLWDSRNMKKPLATRDGLPNHYAHTSVIWAPDGQTVLTGTSVKRAGGGRGIDEDGGATTAAAANIVEGGAIYALSRQDLSISRVVPVVGEDNVSKSPVSVVRLHWASKTNQILASTSSGAVEVFYDAQRSNRGALLGLAKKVRVRNRPEDWVPEGPILTPHAPQDGGSGSGSGAGGGGAGTSAAAKKRRLEKDRQGAGTRMPDRPMSGPGKGGRIGAAATQHVVQNIWRDNTRSEDPREALLRYADKGEEDLQWTGAWKKTQPKAIFRQDDEDGNGDGDEEGG